MLTIRMKTAWRGHRHRRRRRRHGRLRDCSAWRSHELRRRMPCVGLTRLRCAGRADRCGQRGHRRHAVGHGTITIIRMIAVVITTAIEIIDLGDIRDVGDVDPLDVGTRYGIRRHIHLSRCQRKPASHGRALRPARYGEVHAALPANHGRRPDRPRNHRARRPAPAIVDRHPAPVMRRRIAPRRIVDPGPAPRRHPQPASVPVGRPICGHHRRCPDRAIVGRGAPHTVAIQLFVASGFGRDIAYRLRAVIVAVARQAPAVETVIGSRHAQAGDLAETVVAIQAGASSHDQRRLAALAPLRGIEARRAVDHMQAGGRRVAPGVDPKASRLQQADLALRRLQAEFARCLGISDTHGRAAIGQVQRQPIVVQGGDQQFGLASQADHAGTDPDLGPGIRRGGNAVAAGQRPVDRGLRRIGLFAGAELHVAFQVGDPADTCRGIGQRGKAKKAAAEPKQQFARALEPVR